MALDVMTVPAMSSECERLFSATGLMVTPLRNRLDAGTIVGKSGNPPYLQDSDC
ncbi:hypothetical protein FOC1_g10000426 [Fusarium oxysporum f. sp. cubense race 1]|uniref:HAT C-terminal dimerisation domain-containing protein n=1 Tax=Fusarium oxysporum f. sp. cubense (strain race 1) TaxID=1229664 RepID=N4U856_FUSC1|nr:hypothetical protein FOC1_g10000426 [Fusarium oxysporum f. sp. cubense race 1]